ncbi:hypothetical protein CPC08DRAFT_729280 [Agrocybe pediades]|nr:hypothetical protein CPC08DRAFT_729280 [Agrocybe pediades]
MPFQWLSKLLEIPDFASQKKEVLLATIHSWRNVVDQYEQDPRLKEQVLADLDRLIVAAHEGNATLLDDRFNVLSNDVELIRYNFSRITGQFRQRSQSDWGLIWATTCAYLVSVTGSNDIELLRDAQNLGLRDSERVPRTRQYLGPSASVATPPAGLVNATDPSTPDASQSQPMGASGGADLVMIVMISTIDRAQSANGSSAGTNASNQGEGNTGDDHGKSSVQQVLYSARDTLLATEFDRANFVRRDGQGFPRSALSFDMTFALLRADSPYLASPTMSQDSHRDEGAAVAGPPRSDLAAALGWMSAYEASRVGQQIDSSSLRSGPGSIQSCSSREVGSPIDFTSGHDASVRSRSPGDSTSGANASIQSRPSYEIGPPLDLTSGGNRSVNSSSESSSRDAEAASTDSVSVKNESADSRV